METTDKGIKDTQKEPPETEKGTNELEKRVWGALKTVMEPELAVPMIDLGLIYGVEAADGRVHIRMTLTSPFCPMSGYMVQLVEDAARAVEGVESVEVEVVFDPPWDPMTMATEEVKQLLGYGPIEW